MNLNDSFEHQFSFTQLEVNEFARITGDNNPIHIDEAEAVKSIFKRRIMHGFLSGSVFSKVFGTLWPGKGTIFLGQNMRFVKPMYVDETYKALFKIVEVKRNGIYVIDTSIVNTANEVTLSGEAVIKYV
ncbi:MAG: MaoC family dehydratase [Bacteroidales bacterium]|jgi:acyl dehydratase|nr:MaoC family dehydratase [Bacteroidales bacterium]